MSWDPNAATPATSWDPSAATTSAAWDPNAWSSESWDPNAVTSSTDWEEPAATSSWEDPAASAAWDTTSSAAWDEPTSSSWAESAATSSAPASTAAAPSPSSSLPSQNLPPIPHDPSQPPIGGSASSPAYFYNATLPVEGHISCSTTYRNVTKLCCPPELGIWDAGAGGAACRMPDDSERKNWIITCAQKLWEENNPSDPLGTKKARVRCMPFQEELDERGKDRREDLRVSQEGRLGCGTLGHYDGVHDYTGQCCSTLGGEAGNFPNAGNGTSGGPSFPESCTLNPDQQTAWEECIKGMGTWGTCTTASRISAVNVASAAGRIQVGAGLVAIAMGLAVLV